MLSLLLNHRVVVCTGSGGVGKTTTAAALGVAAARAGRRVLVLTIDPAQRLATTLGISNSAEDIRVPGQDFLGELWAGIIDPPSIFAAFILRHAKDRGVADRLFNNPLYQQLSTTLSGSQEFTALAKLHEAATSDRYDLVILDTPPAAHAADFLQAPARLDAVFDSTIVSLFMGRTRGLGLATLAWKRSMKLVLGALTLLTGSSFVATFNDFFSAIDAIAPDIRETNRRAQALLLDPGTAFVLISSFDAAKLQEGQDFHAELSTAGYHLREVIINRAWPQWLPVDGAAQAKAHAALLAEGEPALADLFGQLADYHRRRPVLPECFAQTVLVPEMDDDLIGLPALETLAVQLTAAVCVPASHAGAVTAA